MMHTGAARYDLDGFVKKSIVLCLPTLNTFYPK